MKLFRAECTIVAYFLLPDNFADDTLPLEAENAILNELEESGPDNGSCHNAKPIIKIDQVSDPDRRLVPWDNYLVNPKNLRIEKLFQTNQIT